MSSLCREVITLQIGHYSNFIGTHWWNLQHSNFVYKGSSSAEDSPIGVNHDFLFREGCLPNGSITYTPRLLSVDAKGSLGTLPKSGMLYEDLSYGLDCDHLWKEKVDIINQLPEKKNDYLRALEEEDELLFGAKDEDKDICSDDTLQGSSCVPVAEKVFDISKQVNVWSDFLRPHLHPNSIFILNEIWHQNESESASNWGFLGGASILKKEENLEEITNRIRILAESCESLQGFQLLSDCHNGMGGISWIVAQHLADEYQPKDLFSFLSTPPQLDSFHLTESSFFLSSVIQCYSELSQYSSLLVPLNLKQHAWHTWAEHTRWPYIHFEMNNPFLTSSVLASFLDTSTLSYRKKTNPLPMAYLSYLLTPHHRKCVSGSLSMPLGNDENMNFQEWLLKNKNLDLISITGGGKDTSSVSEYQMLRGIPDLEVKSLQETKSQSAWEFYRDFLSESGRLSRNHFIDGTAVPMKIKSPFPSIFKKEVQEMGSISQASKFPLRTITSTSLAAGLHQGDGIQRYLEQVMEGASALNVARIPRLMEEGIDQDSWRDVLEEMRTLLGCYGSKWSRSSYSDDDMDD